jgi:hypothetical protein
LVLYRYFKVEVWDCDASVSAVANVVRDAITQAKQQADVASSVPSSPSTIELNPDGTAVSQPEKSQEAVIPAQVSLPSTSTIKYAYIGQCVATLQQLLDADKKQKQKYIEKAAEKDDGSNSSSSVKDNTPTDYLLSVPVINASQWQARGINQYCDSGTLYFDSIQIVDAE